MKMIAVLCLSCALVALGQAQDMTSMMFQAMGIEMPPLPPSMPQSLREHLYPQQQQLRRQQLYRLQQAAAARAAAYRKAAALQKATKNNPYSVVNKAPEKPELLVSQANVIRQPGVVNELVNKGNPYSVSRAGSSNNPIIRKTALGARRPAMPSIEMYRQYRQWRDQPRKIQEAQAAGCKLPVDSSAASILMFGDCRNPTARMVCQMEMMSCVNVGMSAMCCPFGMNKLAMDTISYVNKLQHFVSEVA
ncbi:uncharacterized protein LOC106079846 [Biomphalaria glabrata]|uniref:Uncharacterized protein LOC106079846 n=1 Tax=Biomphalaria glabrata TaxID=6526 RepID=A0A9W2YVR1_BIOGL|nr:uncharacterized protein LOC106079846 [Biomphalaria glabrata]XP_055866858.1 uncharacterized protein LOC106079846 [Biomphalaria glabrata]KAI8747239.1 Shell-related protein; partial [Biomphalaria glabrata]